MGEQRVPWLSSHPECFQLDMTRYRKNTLEKVGEKASHHFPNHRYPSQLSLCLCYVIDF